MDHDYKVDTVIQMYFCGRRIDAFVEHEEPLGELVNLEQEDLDELSASEIGDLIDMGRQEWLAENIDSGWKVKE